ncbi:uncharacterized protein N7506_004681 [Penicillium brevicompactum]|uniref:uncharacterized protein n=1 Tax=Penicillium brevicompactum TaxID=5074 RepID=UPI0025420D63|nr:uncharacterized protein N7506_004681 [Penicillium brevicompactum]KAJ5336659.1 hypothetical protein N7506_004681 [Penicillium brevicompactum]
MEETVLTDRKKIIEWWLANPVLPGSRPHSFPVSRGWIMCILTNTETVKPKNMRFKPKKERQASTWDWGMLRTTYRCEAQHPETTWCS